MHASTTRLSQAEPRPSHAVSIVLAGHMGALPAHCQIPSQSHSGNQGPELQLPTTLQASGARSATTITKASANSRSVNACTFARSASIRTRKQPATVARRAHCSDGPAPQDAPTNAWPLTPVNKVSGITDTCTGCMYSKLGRVCVW